MTPRERFLRLMRYEPIDRLPVMAVEPVEPMAIARWHREGLPDGADVVDFLGLSKLVHVPVNSMGMERFLSAFHEEPDLVHDVFALWSEFVAGILKRVRDSVSLDFALFTEDLAGKNGPLVSPRLYDEFWHPYQDPLLRMLREHNVPVICQWSAGSFEELLPGMLDHGFRCTWPLEVIAGMDALQLRERFGRRLLLGGNIAKEAVIAGPAAIDREIDRLLPLIREGGFLPALDDMASPDMPFAHYRHMIERLQGIRLS